MAIRPGRWEDLSYPQEAFPPTVGLVKPLLCKNPNKKGDIMRRKKGFLGVLLGICLLAVFLLPLTASAATDMAVTPKLTVYVGNTRNLNPGTIRGKKTWTSSKPTVVSVAKRGIITAFKTGTAKIKVTNGKKTYSCKVTVLPVSMRDETVRVAVKQRKSIRLYCGTNKGITWESSDPTVLAYRYDTGSKSVWKALKAGTATVTATYNGKQYSTLVIVENSGTVPTPTPAAPDMGDTVLPEI